MKTKTIFKALALAMLMPAMVLTTACSNDDNLVNNTANTENTINKGYALPVTVNVTRQGDAATRATYNESTRKLEFGAGDKLFVWGYADDYDCEFAGELTWQSGGTFSGTIYTENEWTKTADALFTAASNGYVNATLLPAGYGSYGFLTIENNDTEDKYDDFISDNNTYTLATSKAAGVEQFSYEEATGYSSGFELEPQNAILNFTITGLAASTSVNVSLTSYAYTITGTVTTDSDGKAVFGAGVEDGTDLNSLTLTVAGNPVTLVSSEKTLEAGKIYNITRAVTPPTLASVFNDGATVLVKANTKSGDPNLWYGVTGTYNESTSEYATTSCGSSSLYTPKTVSMTKDGNNLVVFMESNYNQITITFNTTNNTYRAISTSSPAGVAINTFTTLIVNGVDITSTLTAVPSETITLTGGSDMGVNTYSGTHFQVTGEGYEYAITVNPWKNMVISATTGKTIVDVVFSYYQAMNLNALSFSSGTFNGSNMVENVNATSLTVGSTSPAGTPFNGVTIYYSE